MHETGSGHTRRVSQPITVGEYTSNVRKLVASGGLISLTTVNCSTGEIRDAAQYLNPDSTCAKLFWWYNRHSTDNVNPHPARRSMQDSGPFYSCCSAYQCIKIGIITGFPSHA